MNTLNTFLDSAWKKPVTELAAMHSGSLLECNHNLLLLLEVHYCVLWIHWPIETDSSHKAASFCQHVPLNCCLCRRLAGFRSEARPLTRTDCVSKQRIKRVNVESEIWTFVQLIKITACVRSAGDSQLHCALTANLNVKTHVCVCVCESADSRPCWATTHWSVFRLYCQCSLINQWTISEATR